MSRPLETEYESTYIKYYVDLVQGDDIIKALESQMNANLKFFRLLNEEQGNYAYAENKWTLKEVIGHMNDTERIFGYRALALSRGEQQNLPSFDQDEYVRNGHFAERSLNDLINEYKTLRESNICLFKSFNADDLSKSGIASGRKVNVRTLLYMIAGHELHHVNVIRTKYLN